MEEINKFENIKEWDYLKYKGQTLKLPLIKFDKVTVSFNKHLHVESLAEVWTKDNISIEYYELITKNQLFDIMVSSYSMIEDENDFLCCVKLNYYGFLMDSVHENLNSSNEIENSIFYGKDSKLGLVLKGIYNDYYKCCPKENVDYLIKTMTGYANGVLLEKTGIVNASLNKKDYFKIREYDMAMYVVIKMINMQVIIPLEIQENDLFIKYNKWASKVNIWLNDIFSFFKESKEKRMLNYVKILTIRNGGSIQKAIDYIVELVYHAFSKVDKYENQLKEIQYTTTAEKNNLLKYIENINYLIAGVLYMYPRKNRYSTYFNSVDVTNKIQSI